MRNETEFIVIIPVYNSNNYIEKCIESLRSQSYKNWYAVFIDDCSTDTSYTILKKYEKIDSRINVYRNTSNLGPGPTRNKGIELLVGLKEKSDKSKYILFMDSDDWIKYNYLKEINKIILKDNSDVIFINVIQENTEGEFIKYQKSSDYKDMSKEYLIRTQMTGKLPWGGVRKVVKDDIILENNIRYSDTINAEEAIYSFKLLYYSEKISFAENAYYHYVIRENSQSSVQLDNPYEMTLKYLKRTLVDLDLYDEYKDTYISFVFTALIISIYRVTTYHGLFKGYQYARKIIREFREMYGFGMDMQSLETRVKLLVPFAKYKFISPIILLAFLKALRKKTKQEPKYS